jgi:hypothetical protein
LSAANNAWISSASVPPAERSLEHEEESDVSADERVVFEQVVVELEHREAR